MPRIRSRRSLPELFSLSNVPFEGTNADHNRLPDSATQVQAALAEPLSVVLHAFKRAKLEPGSRVLVLGAGAVGLLSCALARASGCTSVIAVDIEEPKLEFAKKMGWATGTYLLPKGPRVSAFDALEPAKKNWEDLRNNNAVQSVEGLDAGFDAVFECTGGESYIPASYSQSPLPHFIPSF